MLVLVSCRAAADAASVAARLVALLNVFKAVSNRFDEEPCERHLADVEERSGSMKGCRHLRGVLA